VRIQVVTVVLAVALLAGCGGGSKSPSTGYVSQMNAVASGLDSVTNDLYTPTDPSSAVAELVTVHAALAKAARQLATITPPRAVKADHEQLVQAVEELAAGVGPVITKLKSGNLDGAGAALSLRAAAKARKAIEAIDRAGYPIRFELLG
jgi:hypothetical protein